MSTAHDELDPAEAAPSLKSGVDRLGQYVLKKKLGAGGMGTVFLALDTKLNRNVALKILPPDKAQNPTLVKRFRSEAQKAAQLRHENIIAVYDTGEIDGYCYIAMEYVEGVDVHDLVEKRGLLSVKRSIDIIKQVAKALQHAFEQGIVHRDIKPSNLMIRRDGVVKLADMGLARSLDENLETGITRAGTTVGTVDYMSPEQATNSKLADTRSDIYSLGCTWYHMLTGHPPFPEGSLSNKLAAHAKTKPPDPRDENPRVPDGVVAVIHRMMAKDPAKRFQTPRELIEELEGANISKEAMQRRLLSALDDSEGPIEPDEESPLERGSERTERRMPPRTRVGEAPVIDDDDDEPPARRIPPRTRALNVPDEPSRPARPRSGKRERDELSDEPPEPRPSRRKSRAVPTAGKNALPPRIDGRRPAGELTESGVRWWLDPQVIAWAGGVLLGAAALYGLFLIISNYTVATPAGPVDPNARKNAGVGPAPVPVAPTTKSDSGPEEVKVVDQAPPPPAFADGLAARLQQERNQMPPWTQSPYPAGSLATIVVRDQPQAGEFATLEAALTGAPAEGAIFELHGAGPFPFPAGLIAKKWIVLRAGSDVRPLVVIAGGAPAGEAAVRLEGGSLALEHVDLLCDAGNLPDAGDVSLIRVTGGNFAGTDSSISLRGQRTGTTAAVRVDGVSSRDGAQVLLKNAVVRGLGMTALRMESTVLDAIVHNSLVVSGPAPVLRLPPLPSSGDRSERIVRVVSSTLAGKNAVSLGHAGQRPPPATHLLFHNSVLTSATGDAKAALLAVDGWPIASIRTPAIGALVGVNWQATQTVMLGWAIYVDDQAGREQLKLTSADHWRELWPAQAQTGHFQSTIWPVGQGDRLAERSIFEWSNAGIKIVNLNTDGNLPPGCYVHELTQPDFSHAAAARGSQGRPAAPPALATGPTVDVDLNKNDLGKIIASTNWTTGTTFLAHGSGLRYSSQIKIDEKWCQIVFRQDPGPPLELQPDKSLGKIPLFWVRRGRVELDGLNATLPNVVQGESSAWLMEGEDGSFAMRRSRLQGPWAANARALGFVRLASTSGGALPEGSAGRLPCVIENCMVSGTQVAVDSDDAAASLVVRNSILATQSGILRIRTRHGSAYSCDFERASMAAGGAFFVVDTEGSENATSPVQFFLKESLFLPGPNQKAGVVLAAPKPLVPALVQWTENACGYSAQVAGFLSAPGEAPPASRPNFQESWVKLWGADRVARPLGEPGDVLLKAPLPSRPPYEPNQFTLHETCKATKWGTGGRPLGADVAALQPLFAAAAEAATKKPAETKPTAPAVGF